MKTAKTQKGVTMIEMVVVAVVIGLMAALAVPSFYNYSSKLEAKNTARNIVSTLRMARSKAISERVQYGVFFDATHRRYIYFKDLVNPGSFLFEAGDSVVSDDTLTAKVNLGTNTFSNTTVVFTTSGSASTSGDLTVVPASGGDTFNINVLASTGRVKLSTI